MIWKIRANGSTYDGSTYSNLKEVNLTPLKAIQYQCRECFGFQYPHGKAEQKEFCTSPLCSLYPFSPFGLQNSAARRNLTDEQRKRLSDSMRINCHSSNLLDGSA